MDRLVIRIKDEESVKFGDTLGDVHIKALANTLNSPRN